MSRLFFIVAIIFVFSSCTQYRSACQTKAGKKKLEYYNSIQYQKAVKYQKKKHKKRRVAWSY